MAIALHSFKTDSDGEIRIAHVFYAANEKAARALMKEHADACPKFGPAVREGSTTEIIEEIDELPEGDEDDLLKFLELSDDDEEDEDEHG